MTRRTKGWKRWLHSAAMHPLALLCVGMCGERLLYQDGAPGRKVVPLGVRRGGSTQILLRRGPFTEFNSWQCMNRDSFFHICV